MPTPKVLSGAAAGSLAVVLAYAATQLGLVVPGEVVAALTTLLSYAASWFTPDSTPAHAA